MAAGKVIGRILSLGYPLPGPQVDNYSFLSAPSFFDYDALVVDPRALSLLIEGVVSGTAEAATFTDLPVRNAEPSAEAAALSDVLLRRRAETARLLANGGAIVCFAHPAARHEGVVGVELLDDYYWLPDDLRNACRPPALLEGGGTRGNVVDYQHPLASFVIGQLANITYRAYFDEDHLSGAHVFARSGGGAAIGVDIGGDGGAVIMLPAMRPAAGEARYAMSDALQAGIRHALGVTAAGRAPRWLASYPLSGLEERASGVESARAALSEAQARMDEAGAALDEVERYQRLLWQEGAVGLNEIVVDALRLIGFDVYAQDANAVELRSGDTAIYVEIEASEHPIDLAPHYRLRQRIEQAIERRGVAPRGLLIVNGCRLLPPSERQHEVSNALRLAAETMRYAITPASMLFAAVAATLAGDAAPAEAYRCRIASEDGLLA